MTKAALAIISAAVLLGGCSIGHLDELISGPKLTPAGSGIAKPPPPVPNMPAVPPTYTTRASLWQDNGADLFRDARAGRIGDVVTVRVSIRDQANFNNTTNTQRNSTRETNITNTANLSWAGLAGNHLNTQSSGTLDPKIQSNSTQQSQGAVQRSETIDLLVGAVVTNVLPNGNLVLAGKQEVMVNQEVRELVVSGIVRPRDIATDNSISYEKIAEARISYSGRGYTMEMQQPGWFIRAWDRFGPW